DGLDTLDTLRHDLVVDHFATPADLVRFYTEHFAPVIAVRSALAGEPARVDALDRDLLAFAEETDEGGPDGALYRLEYLLAVGRRSFAEGLHLSLRVVAVGVLRPGQRIDVPVGPRLVDDLRVRRPVREVAVVAREVGVRALVPRVRDPGVEPRRRRRAVGDREPGAGGELPPGEMALEHVVGGVERPPRVGTRLEVPPFLGLERVEHDRLDRRRDVLVEEAVPPARLERLVGVGRDHR